MWCGKCDNEVMSCTCGDMTERMRGPTGVGGHVAARWCATCDNHYAECKCSEPEWRLRANGELGPLPGTPGGPETLAQKMGE